MLALSCQAFELVFDKLGLLGGVFCSNGYWQQRLLSLTKPTNPSLGYKAVPAK